MRFTVAAAFLLSCSTSLIAQTPQTPELRGGMAWKTTDSRLGIEITCMAFEAGNTFVTSVSKGGQIFPPQKVSAQDLADCMRGLQIARKNKTVVRFTPEDLKQPN